LNNTVKKKVVNRLLGKKEEEAWRKHLWEEYIITYPELTRKELEQKVEKEIFRLKARGVINPNEIDVCKALDESLDELKSRVVAVRRQLTADRELYPRYWSETTSLLRDVDTISRLRFRLKCP